MKKIATVQEYNDLMGVETLNPLVSVIDFSHVKPLPAERALYGLYCIFLKEVKCGDMIYGNTTYDYQDGTIVTTAPGQVYGFDRKEKVQPKGWALVFHPDFIYGTELAKNIRNYHFFSYDSREALHLSLRERAQIEDCFRNIQFELERAIDKHTQTIICREINLMLDLCQRFYDRQFITRHVTNSSLLTRFETLLDEYVKGEDIVDNGLPSVSYFADKLCLSPNYFGDLVKKYTGITAKEMIQNKLMDVAKTRLLASDDTVGMIADSLGFQYAGHFTRMFKKFVGMTPQQFRHKN
jgi:AraC-like DNA-binding protein